MIALSTFATAEASPDLLAAIQKMLVPAFDGDFSDEDWEHALGGRHFLIAHDDDVLAHAAVVPRVIEVAGHPFRTGYVEGVATARGRHGEGLGSQVMTAASDHVRHEFALGALGTGRHSFYERLGWERWRGPTYVRRDAELARTEEDDDGVMVLRFGESAGIELTDPISCAARPGDDW